MSSELLALSLFFHLMATAVWIGGLLITMLLVWPALRRNLEQTQPLYTMLRSLRKRFYPISNLSLIVLIITGLFQMTADPNYLGFLQFSNTWSVVMLVKHIVIVLMALAGLALQYSVAPTLERTSLLLERGKGDDMTVQQWERLHRREVLLTWAMGLLGVAVLAFSAWLGVL